MKRWCFFCLLVLLAIFVGGAFKPPPPAAAEPASDGLIKHLRISPGDVTVPLGASANFTAVAYDAEGTPVGGIDVFWKAYDVSGREVFISQQGEFVPSRLGTFRVTAQAVQQIAEVSVTVEEPTEWIRRTRARDQFEPSWDESNLETAFEPSNLRGRNPGDTVVSGAVGGDSLGTLRQSIQEAASAGSSNFQLSVPVVDVPGRGLDLVLNLTYNSRLWHKAKDHIFFGIDGDWPAQGWSLGFGKIIIVNQAGDAVLVDADGTRHPYEKKTSPVGIDFAAHTTDGTLIDYSWNSVELVGGGFFRKAFAKYPNGTVVEFASSSKRGSADILYRSPYASAPA